ncbi:DNA-binding response regulator [Paenibacillus sp. FSL H8-0548]|uniref:response regulator n=1 Tax=Paenibacillus sp. FSL H8-0548 TaxID=1920422 RepID=UPI00096C8341|nr:response regulator [Paenibacillus sp. FSL H8-0548]OMF28653.1 DNA-binding response regulator [Paenibacillus sp. FSL H8-0548]
MIRVMLIDDEEDALDLLEILLRQIGHVKVVGRYVNPIQALEALSQFPIDGVDAVFLDNQMPGMRGTEVARTIRKTRPQMPIVFTTAYAEYAVEAFEIQSTDYLLKPFTIKRLQKAVALIKPHVSEAAVQARPKDGTFPHIQFFGGFHIQLSDNKEKRLAWKTKKEKELCAFLLHYEGRPVNTASIIEALWPEYDLNKAKTYLYTCMSYLRKSLTDNNIPISIQKADQGFVSELNGITSDVMEFETLLNSMISDERYDERMYDKMNAMYKGPYMEACDFKWADVRQMKINASYIRALRKWHEYFYKNANTALALDSMQRLLSIEPDSEADGRKLIKLHLEMGNRNEALHVYLQLEQAVRVQLGAALEEATLLLYRQAINQ